MTDEPVNIPDSFWAISLLVFLALTGYGLSRGIS